MQNTKEKIKSFTGLIAWQEGHKLVLSVYRGSKPFPKEETFGLTGQLRRAVVSITSNIAEGFSRTSTKEKLQFFSIALGSLTESQNLLLVARDVGYLIEKEFNLLAQQTVMVSKLINGLIRKCKFFLEA